MTKHHVIHVETGKINLSPHGFHQYAIYYFQCSRDYVAPKGFSPVRLFLLALSIELELKSRHLQNKTQIEVREEYGHDLVKSYDALPAIEKLLSATERAVLERLSYLYDSKGRARSGNARAKNLRGGKQLEYFHPIHAVTAYSNFPDAKDVEPIAMKLIGEIPEETYLRQLFRGIGQKLFGNRSQVRINRLPLKAAPRPRGKR